MTLKSHAKFEEKLTCGLQNDMRNLANFHQNNRKCKNWYFHGMLLSKVKNACHFKIDRRDLTNFDSSTRKSKKFTL